MSRKATRFQEDRYHRKEILEAIEGLQRSRKTIDKANIVKYVYKQYKISPFIIIRCLRRLHELGCIFKVLIKNCKCYVNAQMVSRDIQSALSKFTSTTEESQEYSELFDAMTREILVQAFMHLLNEKGECYMCKGFFQFEIKQAIREVLTKRKQCLDLTTVFPPSLDLIMSVLPEMLKREVTNGNLKLLQDGRYQVDVRTIFANLEGKIRSKHLTRAMRRRLLRSVAQSGTSAMIKGDEWLRNKESAFQLRLSQNTSPSLSTTTAHTLRGSPIVLSEELRSSAFFGQINTDAAKSFLDELIQRSVNMKVPQENNQSLGESKVRVQFYEWLKKHL